MDFLSCYLLYVSYITFFLMQFYLHVLIHIFILDESEVQPGVFIGLCTEILLEIKLATPVEKQKVKTKQYL